MAIGLNAILALLVMKESYPPVLLERKAKQLRRETGNESLRSVMDTGLDPKHLFSRAISRPTKLLTMSPICALMSLYIAIVSISMSKPLMMSETLADPLLLWYLGVRLPLYPLHDIHIRLSGELRLHRSDRGPRLCRNRYWNVLWTHVPLVGLRPVCEATRHEAWRRDQARVPSPSANIHLLDPALRIIPIRLDRAVQGTTHHHVHMYDGT